jgi:signal transduction histidine kinase
MKESALAQDVRDTIVAQEREQESAARTLAEEREQQAAELASIVNRVDRTLRQATERLAQSTNVRSVIIDMLRESSTIVGSQGVIECGLLLYDPVSRLLHFEAMFADGVETDLQGTSLQGPFSVDSEPLAMPWMRIQQESWLWGLTDDASILAPTAREYHESNGARSVAYLPLRRGEACVGFVGFSLRSEHPPTPQQVDLLQSVGSQAALAVEVQRLARANEQASVARERQRLADLRSIELTKANLALQATIDAVTHMQSLDDFMPRVVAIVARAFESVGAGYFEHPGGTIHHRFWLEDGKFLAAAELPALDPVHLPVLELLTRGFSVPPEHLGVEFRQRLRPSIVHHRVATASPAMHALCVSRGWDWELNIPLFANDRTEAAITFFRHEDQPFAESDVSLAESLAKQISLARQVSRLAERARIDSLARAQEQAVARERERMSRDIHDTLAQGYAAILIHAQAMKLSLRSEMPEPVQSGIEMFERLAKENLAHARRTMEDLHADPFGRVALIGTLRQCADEESSPGIFAVELDTPAEEFWVRRYVEVELRRIVKEALSNARRHARAGQAMVKLSVWERRCTIRVIDRGVGFDPQPVEGSFGIRGMRERAGRAGADLAIETSPGHGTIVTVTIDMESSGDGERR